MLSAPVTPIPQFQPGDKVWLDGSDIRTTRPSKKLSHRWLGPYTVLQEVGKGAYKLKLPPSMKLIHPVFPVIKLDRYEEDPIPGRRPDPPPEPEIIDDEPEWEVEEILDSRRFGRWKKLQYFVRWKGYGPQDDSWERAEDLVNAPNAVAEFYAKYPEAVKSIHTSRADLSNNWRSASRSLQI